MDNPLILWTRKASGVLGALIREWTLDPSTRPAGHRMEGERICVIPASAFREALAGLVEGAETAGADYQLRDGIAEVELILRRPDRLAFLMPEEDILREQAAIAPGATIRVPALYIESGQSGTAPSTPAVESTARAAYEVEVGKDPLRTFLDPYLASYSCMQCK